MMIEPGMVVMSCAGHDAGTYYLVLSLDHEGHVFLADGRRRKLANPKRKNIRHLRRTRARMDQPETNKKLREALRAFRTDEGGNKLV